MPEMPYATEDHDHATLVGRVDHFLVAHRTTWLNDTFDACFRCIVNSITEWEERIGSHDCTIQVETE